jgi:hypothetical protein
MKTYISPRYTDLDLPPPHSYRDKVTLFCDRFRGWKLQIALKVLDGYEDEDGKKIPGIADSGYAALDIVFSYFEAIGKHVHGYCDTDTKNPRASGKYFKLGVRSVLPSLDAHPDQSDVDVLLDMLWTGVRCGLYHAGQTKGNIGITVEIPEPIRIATKDKVLFLNPKQMIAATMAHLDAYESALVACGESSDLGQRFTARYDFEN